MSTPHITVTPRQLKRVMADLHVLGYKSLPNEDQAICDAFDAGKLTLDNRSDDQKRWAHEEQYGPQDYNDADGVQTMGDFA